MIILVVRSAAVSWIVGCNLSLRQSCLSPSLVQLCVEVMHNSFASLLSAGTHDSDGCYFLCRLSRRCEECQFDVCYCCSLRHITQLHPHPLYLADLRNVYPQLSGCWLCDNCCRRSSPYDTPNNWRWHCYKCSYDLCGNCIGDTPGIKTGEQPCDLTTTCLVGF